MFKKLLLLVVVATVLANCSNDFELTSNWREIPVMYAILSAKDTANYVRVEKAFLDPERSALQIAQIPDSLYFKPDAITVYIEQVSNGKLIQLNRMDGTLDGIIRKGEIFANKPNWLYKTKEPLLIKQKYRIVVKRKDGKPDITAETTMPGDFSFSAPSPIEKKIEFYPRLSTSIKWFADESAKYFDVTILIRYREFDSNGNETNDGILTWHALKSQKLTKGNGKSVEIPAGGFASFLASQLKPFPEGYRQFGRLDIIVEGGGSELERFQEVAAASAGITGAEVVSAYSNVFEGDKPSYGLVMAKNRSTLADVRVQQLTIDSLNVFPNTKVLNFR